MISTYKNSNHRMSGVVDTVDKSRDRFKFYHIKFDNGDEDWVRLYDLQFLPKDVTHTESSGEIFTCTFLFHVFLFLFCGCLLFVHLNVLVNIFSCWIVKL